ncbi:MAG: DUF4301 family protein [Nitrospirae bacterium]|nr:MAG: DUF4301 family protein [Nitrospirota bacterium]
MLTVDDYRFICEKGIPFEQIEHQLSLFQRGFPYIQLVRPCTVGDGIRRLSSSEISDSIQAFDEAQRMGRAMKFVPASGAATRMFKDLLAFWQRIRDYAPDRPILELDTSSAGPIHTFFANLPEFAFYQDLQAVLARAGFDCQTLLATRRIKPILEYLLFPVGLDYAHLPKGLLPFHRYPDHIRTPIAEHIVEATVYTADQYETATVHFTMSPDHLALARQHVQQLPLPIVRMGKRLAVTFSPQRPSTDTIAVDLDNKPFRTSEGRLVFRPGGHGALLHNLNDLQGDLIFIKNIDNVLPDSRKAPTYTYKKALGGLLVTIQRQVFDYLEALASDRAPESSLHEMMYFASETLSVSFPEDFSHWPASQRKAWLFDRLDRPLRVCGMVPNTGEPGGGPFWVRHPDGRMSLQIVEAAQVDPAQPDQQAIFAAATHFNPVDMVCGVRDFRRQPFDLFRFRDPGTGLITIKSYEGRELKALEWPGLWNGGMAYWNTVFVEIPLETFAPVKTILDLLRPEHRA